MYVLGCVGFLLRCRVPFQNDTIDSFFRQVPCMHSYYYLNMYVLGCLNRYMLLLRDWDVWHEPNQRKDIGVCLALLWNMREANAQSVLPKCMFPETRVRRRGLLLPGALRCHRGFPAFNSGKCGAIGSFDNTG